MVRLTFFDDDAAAVWLTFCTFILTLSPNLLNCLSSCLINSKSSCGSVLNASSTFFGPFVGLIWTVAFLSACSFFRVVLAETKFTHKKMTVITCGNGKKREKIENLFKYFSCWRKPLKISKKVVINNKCCRINRLKNAEKKNENKLI